MDVLACMGSSEKLERKEETKREFDAQVQRIVVSWSAYGQGGKYHR